MQANPRFAGLGHVHKISRLVERHGDVVKGSSRVRFGPDADVARVGKGTVLDLQ